MKLERRKSSSCRWWWQYLCTCPGIQKWKQTRRQQGAKYVSVPLRLELLEVMRVCTQNGYREGHSHKMLLPAPDLCLLPFSGRYYSSRYYRRWSEIRAYIVPDDVSAHITSGQVGLG